MLGLHRGSGTTGKEPCLWGEAEVAVIGAVAVGHPGARPLFPSHLIIGPLQNLIFCVPLTCQLILPSPSSLTLTLSNALQVLLSSDLSPQPVIKCALTGIINVEVIADGVSSSGQSFSTKQHSKRPDHRA